MQQQKHSLTTKCEHQHLHIICKDAAPDVQTYRNEWLQWLPHMLDTMPGCSAEYSHCRLFVWRIRLQGSTGLASHL